FLKEKLKRHKLFNVRIHYKNVRKTNRNGSVDTAVDVEAEAEARNYSFFSNKVKTHKPSSPEDLTVQSGCNKQQATRHVEQHIPGRYCTGCDTRRVNQITGDKLPTYWS
ncbi:hypothetical protein ABEB36_002812, partial [Hypothenemus hampei]